MVKKQRQRKDVIFQIKIREKIVKTRKNIFALRNFFKFKRKKRIALRRQLRLKKGAKHNVRFLYWMRRKVKMLKKNHRLSPAGRKRFLDLLSKASLNEIVPLQRFSFKVYGKMLSKRNLLGNAFEKAFLTERFNKSYSVFLSDLESLITINRNIGFWWFKPHVAFYKKQRFIVSTMFSNLLKKYYLRPSHLSSRRGLRSWLLFTPVLRLSRKIMAHDLSQVYPKKINIAFKLGI